MILEAGSAGKFAHIASVLHEGKLVLVATDHHADLWYTVKQDGFEDTALDDNGRIHTGWEDWQPVDLPDGSDSDASVVEQEKRDNIDTRMDSYILRSRYRTHDRTAPGPVQLISGLGHLFVFRQSKDGTLLVDRFVLDGMKNRLNRKLEIRFKRSGQRHTPLQSSGAAGRGRLQQVDSLDFRDVNEHPFHEPTTELSWLSRIENSWFSVVLLPTEDHDVQRWHIFSINAQTQKLEYASIKSSVDKVFDFKDHFTPSAAKGSVCGLISRTFDVRDTDSGKELSFTGAPVANQYDVQSEQDTENGPHLLKEATRVLVSVPTPQGVVSVSFAAAKDGKLSHIRPANSDGAESFGREDIVRATRREVLLPLDTLDAVKAIGQFEQPPHGTFNTTQRGAGDRIVIKADDDIGDQLKPGNLIRISDSSSVDGHYDNVTQTSTTQFQISQPAFSGTWTRIETDPTGKVFDGIITGLQGTDDGVLASSVGHGLQDGDSVQIVETEAINGLHRVAKVDGDTIVLERTWKPGTALNLSRTSGNRRGVRFTEAANDTKPSYGQTGNPDLIDLTDGTKGGFTVSVWVFRSDADTRDRLIFAQADNALRLDLKDGFVTAHVNGVGKEMMLQDPVEMPAHQWVHFAVTVRAGIGSHDSDNVILSLYRDGKEVAFPEIEYTRIAPSWTRDKCNAIDGQVPENADRFGWHVDVSGDTAVISSVDSAGTPSVRIFRREGADWNAVHDLNPADTGSAGATIQSLAIDGDVMVIGLFVGDGDGAHGSVRVFRRGANGWQFSQQINDPVTAPGRRFGCTVAVAGPFLFVGASGAACKDDDRDYPDNGTAYAYRATDTKFGFCQELVCTYMRAGGQYAARIAASEEHVMIAAGGDRVGYRTTFFRFDGNCWTYVASDRGARDSGETIDGVSVALHGTLAILGAPSSFDDGRVGGKVQLFHYQAGYWENVGTYNGADVGALTGEAFGTAVAINEKHVLVGSPYSANCATTGRILVFDLAHNRHDGWSLQQSGTVAPKIAEGAYSFGSALALSNLVLMVGNRSSQERDRDVPQTWIMPLPRRKTSFHFGGALESLCGVGGEIQLADLQVWNLPRSEKEIKDCMFAILSGMETGLSGYWRLGAIVPGQSPKFMDFSSYKKPASLVGQALLSEKVLDRYLLAENHGHPVEVEKFINPDFVAVMQRGRYEEQIEFKLDDLTGSSDGLFKFIYWGKSHIASDTVIDTSDRDTDDMGNPRSLFAPSKPELAHLGDGWMRLTGTFRVPDGVNLVRTFGLSTATPNWERPDIDWGQMKIRRHSIVNLSEVVTLEHTDETAALTTLASAGLDPAYLDAQERHEKENATLFRDIRHLRDIIEDTANLDRKIAAKRADIAKHTVSRNTYRDELKIWKLEYENSKKIAQLFYNDNYGPADNCYSAGVGRWDFYGTGWDNIVTSLRVPKGLEVVLHRYRNFSPESQTATEDCANVGHRFGYNDETTSITVRTADRKMWNKGLIKQNFDNYTTWLAFENAELTRLEKELNTLLTEQTYDVGDLKRQLAEKSARSKELDFDLSVLASRALKAARTARAQERVMPRLARDERGQQTFGAILGFAKPASRMTAFYSSTGNVQLSYLDARGRIRHNSYDAVADHLNSQFEEWLPDSEQMCLGMRGQDAIVLDTPVTLAKTWTIELWAIFPLADPEIFPSVKQASYTSLLMLDDDTQAQSCIACCYDPHTGAETLGTLADDSFSSAGVDLKRYDAGWHHIAAVGDGTHVKFYIDGICVSKGGDDTLAKQPAVTNADHKVHTLSRIGMYDPRTHTFGAILELRIWGDALNETEVYANSKARLTGAEPGLLAYWPMQEGEGRVLRDFSGNEHNGRMSDDMANHCWTGCGAPIGQIDGVTSADQVVVAEYSRLSSDRITGRKTATMMQSLFCTCPGGVEAIHGKRIEDLDLVWVGNSQFNPTLLGYIEGAPPVPSENLTRKSSYNSASSVALTMSEDVDYSWKRSEHSSLGNHVEFFAGMAGQESAETGLPGAALVSKLEEHKKGVAGGGDWVSGKVANTKIASHSIDHTSDTLSLRGEQEHKAKFPNLGKRFVPKNVGYALVVSGLADVFITRMRRSGRMIGYQITPVADIPPDINTITFLINPAYSMAGSLDGLTGTQASDDRFFGHVPAMSAQYGSSYPASFYRLDEAYDLKQQIERQDKDREAYFENFASMAVTQRQMSYQIGRGHAPGDINLTRAVDKPKVADHTDPGADGRAAKKRADAIAEEGQANAAATSDAAKDKEKQIKEKISDLRERDHASAAMHSWQTKMEAIKARSGKRNIVNSYVWDADGGMRVESQQFSNSAEHTIGGDLEMAGKLGFKGKFFAGVVSADLTVQGTGKLVQSMAKTEAHKQGFGLKVDVGGVEHAGITDHDDYPVMPGEKVDRYRFMSFYLDASTRHFTDFFDYVVDPEWLQSNDEEARALRQSQGKANKTWRVLHRVTYVERPALMGFGRDLRPLGVKPEPPTLQEQMGDLKSELADLKKLLTQQLASKRPN